MKHFVALLCTIILCSVSLDTGITETPIDFDLSTINRGITYAQMLQVCNTPEDYDGKLFRLKGKFNYAETKEMAKIIFGANSGCCELAIPFCPAQALVYPDDYPPLYSDIMITAKLVVDQNDPDMPFGFVEAALEWEEEGISE